MKKIKFVVAMLFAAFCVSTEVNAQTFSDNVTREYKPTKAIKKEAKRLEKEGWSVEAGSMPMAEQLQRSNYFYKEITAEGSARYAIGVGKTKSQYYDAGRAQAIELARLNAASQIQTELASEAKTILGNDQAEQITSYINTSKGMKSLVSQNLKQTIVILELSREFPDGTCEVLIRVAADREQVKREAKRAIREEMKKRGDKILKDLDERGW